MDAVQKKQYTEYATAAVGEEVPFSQTALQMFLHRFHYFNVAAANVRALLK